METFSFFQPTPEKALIRLQGAKTGPTSGHLDVWDASGWKTFKVLRFKCQFCWNFWWRKLRELLSTTVKCSCIKLLITTKCYNQGILTSIRLHQITAFILCERWVILVCIICSWKSQLIDLHLERVLTPTSTSWRRPFLSREDSYKAILAAILTSINRSAHSCS